MYTVPATNMNNSSLVSIIGSTCRKFWEAWRALEGTIVKPICWIQLWAWLGWFPVMFYSSTWVGEIWTRTNGDLSRMDDDDQEKATRIGTIGLLLQLLLSLLGWLFIPRFVSNFRRKHYQIANDYGKTLVDLWAGSQLCFGFLLLISPFCEHNLVLSILLIGACGIPWAITCWVPFTLLGEAILFKSELVIPVENNFRLLSDTEPVDSGDRSLSSTDDQLTIPLQPIKKDKALKDRPVLSSLDRSEEETDNGNSTNLINERERETVEEEQALIEEGRNYDDHANDDESGRREDEGSQLAGTVLGIHNVFIVLAGTYTSSSEGNPSDELVKKPARREEPLPTSRTHAWVLWDGGESLACRPARRSTLCRLACGPARQFSLACRRARQSAPGVRFGVRQGGWRAFINTPRFGLDLLGRENPPPGYYSDSEYWRIQGVGQQPADLTIQMIDCNTSYRLFSPRDSSKPQGSWSLVSSKRKFTISFPAVSTNLEQFREIVATASDEQFRGAGDLIRNAMQSGFPQTDWKISMSLPEADEFKKSAKYTVKDDATFNHWIATVVNNGNDRTQVALEVAMVNPGGLKKDAKLSVEVHKHNLRQAAAQRASSSTSGEPSNPSVVPNDFDAINVLMNEIYAAHPPNVKYQSKLPVYLHPTDTGRYIPLTAGTVQKWATALVSDLKFETLSSAKKRKLNNHSSNPSNHPASDSESGSVVDLGINLLDKYLEFIKIPPSDRDGISHILTENRATNPQLFRSKNITREVMKEWGLHDVFIAQLRDNVSKFENYKSPN
ncbi:hypothetical protein PGTUg99_009636 [Puccinia graminis f. sp. tritici]|uniref:Uncharacterized protein n=1 Tax=Puccinia graminis f. sp. tritici TaxID=56615 RepID=A0A5B0R5U6_PUCGR|nr:hypothetical protein PGTUg99_009636 [Puccinia graminis f. sp. tritici]